MAKELDLEDRFKTMGARMVREIASTTSDVAGDGTTTTTVFAEVIEKGGSDGVITVEAAKAIETSMEVVKGMQFGRGYVSPYFVTHPDTMEAVLEAPCLLITLAARGYTTASALAIDGALMLSASKAPYREERPCIATAYPGS